MTKTVRVICLLIFSLTLAHWSTLSAGGPLPPGKKSTSVKAVRGLLNRLIPGHSDHFVFQWIPPKHGQDLFEIESSNGKVIIRGNDAVSMASGLNWYLQNYCNCHISLNYNRLELPKYLPTVKPKIRKISPFKYRNFFNYCTFSYTMAWWGWERWEKIIDYLALKGVNMPLAITGQEAVWYDVFTELGLKEEQVLEFLVGPAYLPWGWMSNIDGMCGPLSREWIAKRTGLQQKIVARERELGMTPILQGFNGHVPPSIKTLFPDVKLHRTTHWAGMPGTWFLDPRDPLFQRIGNAFIKKQTALFGSDHLYNADCFNEVNPPTNSPEFIARMGEAVFNAMVTADRRAVWVFQGWFLHFQADFWKAPQADALFSRIPENRVLGLDLFTEENPVWSKNDTFNNHPWIWNVFCYLSQKVNMGGSLEKMQRNLAEAMQSEYVGKLQGIGMMMEGFGYNPIIQEFVLEKTWEPGLVDIGNWAADYAYRRYGIRDPRLGEAWRLLMEGPYSRNLTNESILCAVPHLSRFVPNEVDSFGMGYDASKVARACGLLLDKADDLGHLETYRFDLVHTTREMLRSLARLLNRRVTDAYNQQNASLLRRNSKIFLQLMTDLDELLATNEHFMLDKWITDARQWGSDDAEKNFYEWNARTIVTMWEPSTKSQLRDYASRQWSGLMRGFYLPRWELFLDRLHQAVIKDERYDRGAFMRDLVLQELEWTNGTGGFCEPPVGDTVEVARRLYKKYIGYFENKQNKRY